MLRKALPFFTLFTSMSTLICCALPALFVTLGMGAAFAGLVGQLPQLIWVSEHKSWIFSVGALLLAFGGIAQWNARNMPCPIEAAQARACATARKWSNAVYLFSVVTFLIGATFAYGSLLQ